MVLTALAAPEMAYLSLASLPPVRSLVRRRLEQGGDGTFSLGEIGGAPWNICVRDVAFESSRPTNLRRLRTPRASVTLRLAPLLTHGRVSLARVQLEGAEVDIRMDGARPEQIALPLEVGEASVSGSTLRIQNLSGWTATLSDVEATLRPSSGALAASLRCRRASAGSLLLGNVSADVRLAEGRLEIQAFTAEAYGGSLSGRGTLALEGPPFQRVELQASRVGLLPALLALEGSSRFAGRADLKASYEGRFTPALRDLTGAGEFALGGLSVRADLPPNVFNLAPVLQELKLARGLSGGARFRLMGDHVELEDILLDGTDLHVSGHGTMTLAGRIDLDCQAQVRGRLAQGVPGVVRSSLKRSESGDLLVPFKLSRTLVEPKVDIHDVMRGALLKPWKMF